MFSTVARDLRPARPGDFNTQPAHSPTMYAVVGCGECDALWVVEGRPKTTGCPRCGKRHRFDRLRRLAETEDEDAARQARSALLAERSGHGDAVSELGTFDELGDAVDDVGVTDEEYLGGAGIDVEAVEAAGEAATRGRGAGRAARPEVVRAALRELETPTRADVVDYASERDVPPDATRDLLERLVDAGEASEDGGRYRLV